MAEISHNQWLLELVNAYKSYYNTGLYDNRFGEQKILREESDIISRALKDFLEKTPEGQEIRIGDIGAGSGRVFFGVMNDCQIRNLIGKRRILWTGYDISESGLEKFASYLEEEGYKKTKAGYQKDNTFVKLKLGELDDNEQVVAKNIGESDIVLLMFGVINSFITPEEQAKNKKILDQLNPFRVVVSFAVQGWKRGQTIIPYNEWPSRIKKAVPVNNDKVFCYAAGQVRKDMCSSVNVLPYRLLQTPEEIGNFISGNIIESMVISFVHPAFLSKATDQVQLIHSLAVQATTSIRNVLKNLPNINFDEFLSRRAHYIGVIIEPTAITPINVNKEQSNER